MLLSSDRRHSKSVSCTLLQRQIQKSHKDLQSSQRASNPQFVPYCLERKLGKLICKQQSSSNHKPTEAQLLEKINFRNFHKIYRMVSKYENEKYSQLTRKSQQRNLLNKEWRVHSLAKLPNRSPAPSIMQDSKQQQQTSQHKQKFGKMNQLLFKKLSKVKQPLNHPQFQEMYGNYIQICELNENIRRGQLLKGLKQQ